MRRLVLCMLLMTALAGCTGPCQPHAGLAAAHSVAAEVRYESAAAYTIATYLYCASATKEKHEQAFGYTPPQRKKN